MKGRKVPEAEKRLILLQALQLLGSVNSEEMIQFLSEVSSINYFDMMQGLSEMEKSGQVQTTRHPLGVLYSLTQQGRYSLQTFHRRVPASMMRKMTEGAQNLAARFRNEQQSPAVVVRMEDGRDCIRLRLLESRLTALDMMMVLPQSVHMTYVQERWNDRAREIYALLFDTLMRPGTSGSSGATAALIPGGHEEWLLLLQNDLENPTFSVTLALADRELCQVCAGNWTGAQDMLHRRILELLCDWEKKEKLL